MAKHVSPLAGLLVVAPALPFLTDAVQAHRRWKVVNRTSADNSRN